MVKVEINGHPVRALLNSGSLGDFVSTTLVDQVSIAREKLAAPVTLHLAVQGLRSKVNARAKVNLKYQTIDEVPLMLLTSTIMTSSLVLRGCINTKFA